MIYNIDSRLTGVKKIIPSLHKDNRGKFLETWIKTLKPYRGCDLCQII